ncbi:MAG: glutamate--tRNA ligase [Peptococcaceae bacterium]|nr:glutamate--tRNA ligase [Peptococcaceae bacterium]
MSIRVRFAPSPTGLLHIGGARSALFNYLFAAGGGGCLILRSEDTDLARSCPEYEESIADALTWLGIEWQEGLRVGGAFAPYRQSERLDVYRRYVEKLIALGYVYECFCSEEELETERRELSERGESPRYLGRCARLSDQEKAQKRAQGVAPALRFRVRPGAPLLFSDGVRGTVGFDRDGIGDFIIVKSDGVPTYNFAVVIDDLEMAVTHVVRGEEHLSNTPCQLLIWEALGRTPPRYAHISLILNAEGKKMSKRDGDTSVFYYRDQGYLPEAVLNFLALLGWSPAGDQEILSLAELKEQFVLGRVSKAPAVFDRDKLDYVNSCYIRVRDGEELAELMLPYVQKEGLFADRASWEALEPEERAWLAVFADAVKERIKTLGEAGAFVDLFRGTEVRALDEEAREILRAPAAGSVREAFRRLLEAAAPTLDPPGAKALMKQVCQEVGLKGKDVFMPLRVSVTGQVHGPDLDKILALLGPENVLARLEKTEIATSGFQS